MTYNNSTWQKGAVSVKESRKKLLKGIVTAAAAAGAVYGMNRLVFFLSTMKDLLTSKEKSYYNWRFGDI